MRTQSATTTITHAVTVAAGVFAPGHLGELTQYLPFELVDDILAQTKTVQRPLPRGARMRSTVEAGGADPTMRGVPARHLWTFARRRAYMARR